MMDINHIYELAFFCIFGLIFYFFFLPQIKIALKQYGESQNRENVALHDKESKLLREYNKEKKNEDNEDIDTKNFIKKINSLREELQETESARKIHKLALLEGSEKKALESEIQVAKKTIILSLVKEIMKNTPESSRDLVNNFDSQLDVIKTYFHGLK